MNPDSFSAQEQKLLHDCVAAVKFLPIYQSSEFEAIFGNSKDDIEEALAAFPDWDLYDEGAGDYDASGDLVRNSFFYLMNGTEEEKKLMRSHLPFDEAFLTQVYMKARKF